MQGADGGNPGDAAAYLRDTLGALIAVADGHGLDIVAGLLRMAALEAGEIAFAHGKPNRMGVHARLQKGVHARLEGHQGVHTRLGGEPMRRKGEPGKRQIDRDWPHQVRILVPELGLGRRLDDMHAAARAIGAYRPRGDLRGSVDSVRFCFATAEQAVEFARRFGGERLDLKA